MAGHALAVLRVSMPVACNNAAPDLACTWDAENRLIAIEPATPVAGNQRVEFVYDYQGRRVLKQVRPWAGPDPDDWGAPVLVRRFAWSDWLLLMELKVSGNPPASTVVRKYTWGLDLAGLNGSVNSFEGAGGIGGLLAVEQAAIDYPEPGPSDVSAGDYVYTYDGNGNVVQVLDWAQTTAEAAIVARYEYDPYGVIIGPDLDADGDWTDDAEPYALENPLRFSTKYYDSETGLSYYGYRYYSAKLGRWVNRDPIEEEGGPHLFLFSINSPIDFVDPFGLDRIHYTYKVEDPCGYWVVCPDTINRKDMEDDSQWTLKNIDFTEVRGFSVQYYPE